MRSSSPLVPCPVCPECRRILTPSQARFAEGAGQCAECVIDGEEAGKITHSEEEHADAA